MPPRKRQPQSAPPAPAETVGAGLAPAPGNGTPFAELGSRQPAAASPRRGRQLGLRVPVEVYQRLDEVSTVTGISRQRLLVDALTEWLKRYDD